MGGPMPYSRLINRNRLQGWGYRAKPEDAPDFLSASERQLYGGPFVPEAYINREYLEGELRRMEEDTLDVDRVARYAKLAGVEPSQAGLILRMFLGIPEPGCEECKKSGHKWEHGSLVDLGRCYAHTVW